MCGREARSTYFLQVLAVVLKTPKSLHFWIEPLDEPFLTEF